MFVVWHTAPVKTWNDLITKNFTVGGEGSGSDPDIYALFLKNVFGAKLKLITGYPGTAEIAIALERGEVDSPGELVVVEPEDLEAELDRREEDQLPGAAQPDQGRRAAGRADDHASSPRTTGSGRC